MMGGFWIRLRAWFLKSRSERDMDDELRFHIERQIEENVRRGMNRKEARYAALRSFGGVEQVKEECRERRGIRWLDELRQDLHYALRQIGQRPAPSITVMLILGLCIASNTALFAVLDGLLFRPLPFRNSEQLAAIQVRLETLRRLTTADLVVERQRLDGSADIAERAYVLSGSYLGGSGVNGKVQDWGPGVSLCRVSSSFFSLLGARARRGRGLSSEDMGSNPISAVLGYDLWRSKCGSATEIVGQVVMLGDQSVRVVGIMPPEFAFPYGANLWLLRDSASISDSAIPQYVRIAPGVSLAQLRAEFPRLNVLPIEETVRPRGRNALALLFAGNVLILLVGWVQVGALQVARAAARSLEIGVRTALGATRWRLTRQFLCEGTALSTGGVLMGVGATPALTAWIFQLLPPELTRGQYVAMDLRALLFACALAIIGVFFSMFVPYHLVGSTAPMATLRSTPSAGASQKAGRIRNVLIVLQLSLTAVLLYLSGLALQSLRLASSTDLGLDPRGISVVTVPKAILYGPVEDKKVRLEETYATLRALPQAEGVAGAMTYPLQPGGGIRAALQVANPAFKPIDVRVNAVTRDFFSVLRISPVKGTTFDFSAMSPGVTGGGAIVNKRLASLMSQCGPVIGQVVQAVAFRAPVIGVVNDFVDARPDVAPEPQVLFLDPIGFATTILVRTRDGDRTAPAAIRAALAAKWGESNVIISSMDENLAAATAPYGARAILLSWLAAVGVIMAAAGLTGALMYAVQQRTREIAIRLALGASPYLIRNRLLGWALGCVAVALICGIGGGILAGRWAQSLLFGVHPADSVTIVGVSFVLAIAALAAAWWPAARAARVDPNVALREG